MITIKLTENTAVNTKCRFILHIQKALSSDASAMSKTNLAVSMAIA